MSIDISPEHRDFVREELENGHFASEQELIDEAIELLRSRQGVLRKLKNGVEQLERGEGTEYSSNDRQRFVADTLGKTPTAKNPRL
jgi:Arc/MetJ-type ribon-helix-helix transcriptional regulator